MKIGLAQLNTTVGDFAGNVGRMREAYRHLVEEGAELVLYPELVIAGYPPRDLLFRTRFVPQNREWLERFAADTGEVPAIAGFVEQNPDETGRRFFNSVAWCEKGKVRNVGRKCLLPTYDVFDEDRYFEPSRLPLVVEWRGRRIGLSICEDIWNHPAIPTRRHYNVDPVELLAAESLDLLVNCSASPWHRGKEKARRELIADVARRCECPVAYCNQVGGNDELIFDGGSMLFAADGQLLAVCPSFEETSRVVTLGEGPAANVWELDSDDCSVVFRALVLGLRDYVRKSGFSRALIGLSGGIDSALTAAIAVEALGAENVLGVSLPSAISSNHSRADAEALATNLGIRFETIPIQGVVSAAESALSELFEGKEPDVTEENIQARARGLLLMAISNKFGALLLTTGNKSELSVGYCTLYGDMAGGLAVISDVPKTLVFELARWVNRNDERIPWNTIEKPPSAELRPDQKDEDSLPPYSILDSILRLYVEEGRSRSEITASGFSADTVDEVCRKVDLNEYKRKQAAPGLKITPLAFGVGRRIPIVQRFVG